TAKKLPIRLARFKTADDVELADGKILTELRSQSPRQIAHLLKSAGTLFVKPIHNLPGTISRLGQSPQLRLKLIKQERFDLAEVAAATSTGRPPGAMRIGVSRHAHEKAYRTAEVASNGLQVTFACCDQMHCNCNPGGF